MNGEAREFYVNVYPQAYGALADYRFDECGNAASGTAVSGLVLDIGFNTVDVLVAGPWFYSKLKKRYPRGF